MRLCHQIAAVRPRIAKIVHGGLVGLLHVAPILVPLLVWYANDQYWYTPWGDALAISSIWLAFLTCRVGLIWLGADSDGVSLRTLGGESQTAKRKRGLDLREVDRQLRRHGWLLLPLWLGWMTLVQEALPPHAARKFPLIRNVAAQLNAINGAPRTQSEINQPGMARVSLEYSIHPWNDVIYIANKAWLEHDGWRVVEDGRRALFCKDGMAGMIARPDGTTYGKYLIRLEYSMDSLRCAS